MKQRGLLLGAMMLLFFAANLQAQNVYIGGSLSMWRNTTINYSSVAIAPEIGYNFNERWAIGGEVVYSHDHTKGINVNSFAIAPYIRWTYFRADMVRLFLDGSATVGFNRVKDVETLKYGQIGFRPGIAVRLNDHFAFLARYGFLGYQRNVTGDGNAFGLSFDSNNLAIGFNYSF